LTLIKGGGKKRSLGDQINSDDDYQEPGDGVAQQQDEQKLYPCCNCKKGPPGT